MRQPLSDDCNSEVVALVLSHPAPDEYGGTDNAKSNGLSLELEWGLLLTSLLNFKLSRAMAGKVGRRK